MRGDGLDELSIVRVDNFKKLPCLEGKVYCPKATKENKYPCSDCFSCQRCSQDRCTLCRGNKNGMLRKSKKIKRITEKT
jgi:hypothetical protein